MSYFGNCPQCDGEPFLCKNVGKDNWMMCKTCKTCWQIGYGLVGLYSEEITQESLAALRPCRVVTPKFFDDPVRDEPDELDFSDEVDVLEIAGDRTSHLRLVK